jgi:hypothetical protein
MECPERAPPFTGRSSFQFTALPDLTKERVEDEKKV